MFKKVEKLGNTVKENKELIGWALFYGGAVLTYTFLAQTAVNLANKVTK